MVYDDEDVTLAVIRENLGNYDFDCFLLSLCIETVNFFNKRWLILQKPSDKVCFLFDYRNLDKSNFD